MISDTLPSRDLSPEHVIKDFWSHEDRWTRPAHACVPPTYPFEAAELLFAKKFALVTRRTLPPSSWALFKEAWATSSLLRYLKMKMGWKWLWKEWRTGGTLYKQRAPWRDHFTCRARGSSCKKRETLWTLAQGNMGNLMFLEQNCNLSHPGRNAKYFIGATLHFNLQIMTFGACFYYSTCVLARRLSPSSDESRFYCCCSNLISPQGSSITLSNPSTLPPLFMAAVIQMLGVWVGKIAWNRTCQSGQD